MSRSAAILVGLALVAACRSFESVAPVPGPDPLPLRIAFLPITDVERLPARPDRHGDMTVTDMQLSLDPDVVVRALAARLNGAEVVEAEPVADVAAATRGAFDLVVLCRLSYGPDIWQRLAEDYRWFDALGHRRGMSKKDRIYRVDGRLDIDFYDARTLAESGVAVGGDRALLHSIPIYFEELATSLEDRSGGDLGALATTIILVPAYMALEGDELQTQLAVMVPEALAASLAERVRTEEHALLGGPLAPFELIAESTTIETSATGTTVRGVVRLDANGRVRRMRAVQAETAGVRRPGTFEETSAGTAFEVRLPPTEPGSRVRIELVAGSRVLYRRSYTLVVPPAGAEGSGESR